MNDREEPMSDEQIDDLLAPLRAVKLPDGAHAVHAEVVRRALSRGVRAAWWRRTVAVPIPLVIAATLALVFATVALFRPWESKRENRDLLAQTREMGIATSTDPSRGADDAPRAVWRVSRSYIQSIESLANARALLNVDLKEGENDF